MPANTTRAAMPYPLPDDTVDVPRDVKAVADKLETDMAIDAQGTFAARPAPGKRGRYYFATDHGVVYRDDGTAWAAVGPKNQVISAGYRAESTYLGAGGTYALVSMTTRGLGPVVCLLSGYLYHAGVNGNHYTHLLYVRRLLGGAEQEVRYCAGASGTLNGTYADAGNMAVFNPPAGTWDFELRCASGVTASWGLNYWEFVVIELVPSTFVAP